MKIRLHFILLAFLTYSNIFYLFAQPKKIANEENDRMILAYTFYLRQKMSLEFVSVKFPSLKDYVANTMNEWNREFIPSVKNIDSALTSNLNGEWLKNKDALYEKNIRADYSTISEEKAKEFIDVVNDRTYGRIQTPILETFLIWHPKYLNIPEKEFTDGYVNKFSTKEQRSPLAINLKIIYPRSWKAMDGNKKTNVVQAFISGYGLGNVSLTVSIDKAKSDYTNEKISVLLSKESLLKTLQPSDQALTYKSDFTIDNCKAAAIAFYQEKTKSDKKTCSINETYSTYYKNYRISCIFVVSSLTSEDVNEKFKKYQNLFKRIVDNIVILSQWGQ